MESKSIVQALSALAQETRLAIFRALVRTGPSGLSVGEIAAEVRSAPATLSFHLKELTYAGLISPRQDGRYIFYSANYAAMSELIAFLSENCCAVDSAGCEQSECSPASQSQSGKRTPGGDAATSKRRVTNA